MAAKKNKKPSDVLSEVFNRTVEVMGDLAAATTSASVNTSLASARYLVKFQKSSTKAGLNLVGKVQQYTEKTLRQAMKEASWVPDEGKDVVDEWAEMMHSGIDEFGRVIDKSFDLVLKFLERVEKDAKTSQTRKKASAKKGGAKTSAAKKKAATAPGKSTAKRKTTAKKKSPSRGPAK